MYYELYENDKYIGKCHKNLLNGVLFDLRHKQITAINKETTSVITRKQKHI